MLWIYLTDCANRPYECYWEKATRLRHRESHILSRQRSRQRSSAPGIRNSTHNWLFRLSEVRSCQLQFAPFDMCVFPRLKADLRGLRFDLEKRSNMLLGQQSRANQPSGMQTFIRNGYNGIGNISNTIVKFWTNINVTVSCFCDMNVVNVVEVLST
jgi:hypothetical protein